MDKKEKKREDGKARTRSNDSPPIKCAKGLLERLGFNGGEVKLLHDMANVQKKPARKLWKRIYNRCHRQLTKEGAEDHDSAINAIIGDERFVRGTEKIIEEWRKSVKEADTPQQCEMEFSPVEPAAPWLKVEIVPCAERVKFPGGYETKLARVDLLVYGKFKMEGAAEVVIPFNGLYQVRWHFGYSSAFKPMPETKREAEIAIVEAFVRHVDAMRAQFANPALWEIKK